MAISRSTSGIFLSRSQAARQVAFVNNRHPDVVEDDEEFMRGIIIKDISPEELQALRCLQAVEGYTDLGMFEEAEAELRELDPAWFASQRVLSLQLRVLAGLNAV